MYDSPGMTDNKKVSLRPLKFKEAVADLLKVKPEEKPPKKKTQRKKKLPRR
jgi:hypothetical protein